MAERLTQFHVQGLAVMAAGIVPAHGVLVAAETDERNRSRS
ncbi:hypothetical protein [Roseibium sp.]